MELCGRARPADLGQPGPVIFRRRPACSTGGTTRTRRVRLFFVRVDGRMAGSSWVRCELQENLSSALLHVNVLDAFAGRGIGRTLLEHAEALAAADGPDDSADVHGAPGRFRRRRYRPSSSPPPGPGRCPPTRRASVSPEGRLPPGAGGALQSLEIPPAADLDALERDALTRAGDYELLHWTDACPEEHAAQLAVLMSRMSTDAPTGALSYEPETWDVARVRHVEDTWRRAGQSSLVAAARHRSAVNWPPTPSSRSTADKPWLANQDDTLVAAGHRGHRLGMLVKILNLRLLQEAYPAVRRVITFNAAENDHMLAINMALGFKPAGYDGEWQRTAAAAGAATGSETRN